MESFEYYLDEIGEIGFVQEMLHSIAYVSGLPNAHPNESVIFETGDLGEVISINPETVEVLLLSQAKIKVGAKVVRTGNLLQIAVGDGLLGRAFDPLVNPIDGKEPIKETKTSPLDVQPHGIVGREQVKSPLETGVSLVDLAVPLAKGQRELIIGDRKTGKTEFLLQSFFSQAIRGTVCIYAVIGQRLVEVKGRLEFIEKMKISKNSVVIASSSSDPAGLIFLTPYTAMTIAEYFRDQNLDVLLILDDMTTHAKYYREISLLARRFPGRSAYPGDIFYAQARLIERAGNFKKGSITCFPVAESVLGDLSGYIQTNLMAMTDGHIFFDIDLYNQGKRPAVNSGLSVTRVGHQAQTPLQRDLSRELSSFLVEYERMKQFMHFGAEAGETVKKTVDMGVKIDAFFNQSTEKVVPISANMIIIAAIFAGMWNELGTEELKREAEQIVLSYQQDQEFKKEVDDLISSKQMFRDLVDALRQDNEILLSRIGRESK